MIKDTDAADAKYCGGAMTGWMRERKREREKIQIPLLPHIRNPPKHKHTLTNAHTHTHTHTAALAGCAGRLQERDGSCVEVS